MWVNFGGAHPSADVWLNGVSLGGNNAPFVPFGFEITAAVRPEDNLLVVRVHEQNRDLGLAFNWQGNWSGLYRSVELTATGSSSLDRLWIHPDVDAESMRFQVTVDGSDSAPHTLRLTVRSIGSDAPPVTVEKTVAVGDNAFELPVPTPDLWSPDEPNLYRVDVVLLMDEEVMDCRSERTGFVKFSTTDEQFCINDEPYYMRGSCDHHSSPLTGCPDWDRDTWRRNLTTLKEYGYNWIRLVYAYNPEYYDAADEVGIIVQSEMGILGGWGGHSVWHIYQWPQPMPDRREELKWQWDHTVMRDVNRPSANLYCMSNELDEDIDHPRTAWQCYHDTKAIKPTAQIIWTDGGFSDRLPGDYVNHKIDLDVPTRKAFIQHEWRWWSSFPDVRLMDRFDGAMRPWAQEIALEAARRNGIEQLLPQVAANSQRLQFLEMKSKMEILRRDNPTLAGVEHTNGTDLIPSPQGIVDIFYERKYADASTWLQTMGDTVVLSSLGFDDRVRTADDLVTVALSVSDFGHPPFDNPVLGWRLVADGDELATGTLTPAHVPYGTYVAGDVELQVPDLPALRKATLRVKLQEGNRVVTNQWDLWLLPREIQLADSLSVYGQPEYTWLRTLSGVPSVRPGRAGASRALLTERIDETVVDYARAGGRVIVAASEGLVRPSNKKLKLDDHYFFTPPANYPTYEDGQNGTIIADHPALGSLPHEGFADFQFFRLIRDSAPLDLGGLGLTSGDPVIRVLHSYPVSRPLAYLAECSLGKGEVIFCALDLDQSLPEARYLLAQICDHAVNGEARPMMDLAEDVVHGLIAASSLP